MSSELLKLVNASKTFEIGGEPIKVRQLTLFQIAELRQFAIDTLKSDYKKDVADMLTGVEGKEKVDYLLKAIKAFSPSEDDINSKMMDSKCICKVLQMCAKVKEDVAKGWYNDPDKQSVLWDIYSYSLGIEEKEEVKDEKEVKEDVVEDIDSKKKELKEE